MIEFPVRVGGLFRIVMAVLFTYSTLVQKRNKDLHKFLIHVIVIFN